MCVFRFFFSFRVIEEGKGDGTSKAERFFRTNTTQPPERRKRGNVRMAHDNRCDTCAAGMEARYHNESSALPPLVLGGNIL